MKRDYRCLLAACQWSGQVALPSWLGTAPCRQPGFHSLRVNDQWRIIFRWENGASDVSLIDYDR